MMVDKKADWKGEMKVSPKVVTTEYLLVVS